MNIGQISQSATLDQILAAIPALSDVTTLLSNTNATLADISATLADISATLAVLGTTSECGNDLLSVLCAIKQDLTPPTVAGGTGAVGGIAGLLGGIAGLLGGDNPVDVTLTSSCGPVAEWYISSASWHSNGRGGWVAGFNAPPSISYLDFVSITTPMFGTVSDVVVGSVGRMCCISVNADTNLLSYGVAAYSPANGEFSISVADNVSGRTGLIAFEAPIDFSTQVVAYASTYSGEPPSIKIYAYPL